MLWSFLRLAKKKDRSSSADNRPVVLAIQADGVFEQRLSACQFVGRGQITFTHDLTRARPLAAGS